MLSCNSESLILRNERIWMEKKLTITTNDKQANLDREYWRSRTPEERLDAVELLRLEAGKFLYEYPSRLRRIVSITRKTSR